MAGERQKTAAPAPKQIPTAFMQLAHEYQGLGQPYEIGTHPYFSTGAFPFEIMGVETDLNDVERLVMVCRAGTRIEFFSYAIGEVPSASGLSKSRPATPADTNIIAKHSTNNEDFAIEGLSATARGVRVEHADTYNPYLWNGAFWGGPRDGLAARRQ